MAWWWALPGDVWFVVASQMDKETLNCTISALSAEITCTLDGNDDASSQDVAVLSEILCACKAARHDTVLCAAGDDMATASLEQRSSSELPEGISDEAHGTLDARLVLTYLQDHQLQQEVVDLLTRQLHAQTLREGEEEGAALEAALRGGHLQLFRMLAMRSSHLFSDLAYDPSYPEGPGWGERGFRFACQGGHLPVVKELLREEYAHVGYDMDSAFVEACRRGHLRLVKCLLSSGGVAPPYDAALASACTSGHLCVVRELLSLPEEKGVDPFCANSRCVGLAAYHGHLNVLRLLLSQEGDRKVDITAVDNWALRMAERNGHWHVVKEIREHHPNLPAPRPSDRSFQYDEEYACESD